MITPGSLTVASFPAALTAALVQAEIGVVPTSVDSQGNLVWSGAGNPLPVGPLIPIPEFELDPAIVQTTGISRGGDRFSSGVSEARNDYVQALLRLVPPGTPLFTEKVVWRRNDAAQFALYYGGADSAVQAYLMAAVCSVMLREPVEAALYFQDAAEARSRRDKSPTTMAAAAVLAEIGALAAARAKQPSLVYRGHRLAAHYWSRGIDSGYSGEADSRTFRNRGILNAVHGQNFVTAFHLLADSAVIDDRLRAARCLTIYGIHDSWHMANIYDCLSVNCPRGTDPESLRFQRAEAFGPLAREAFRLSREHKFD